MELNFYETEMKQSHETFDNVNDSNYEKYWENNSQTKEKPQSSKKKKVTFDDILTNMNLVVNKSGVLQFMAPNQEHTQHPDQVQHQYPAQNNTYPVKNNSYPVQNPRLVEIKKEQIEPAVKHSYIYNKYFKDYQDANPPVPEIRVPKTKEEYLKMLVEERLRQMEERKRISQIKSTRMLFTTNVGNQGNIQASKNGLRMMSFR
jgi:hypothetical protein